MNSGFCLRHPDGGGPSHVAILLDNSHIIAIFSGKHVFIGQRLFKNCAGEDAKDFPVLFVPNDGDPLEGGGAVDLEPELGVFRGLEDGPQWFSIAGEVEVYLVGCGDGPPVIHCLYYSLACEVLAKHPTIAGVLGDVVGAGEDA